MSKEQADQTVFKAALHHLLADFFGIAPALLNDSEKLATALNRAFSSAEEKTADTLAAFHCLNVQPHWMSDGNSFSFMIQQADAHIILHIYPDHQMALVDILAPRSVDLDGVFTLLLTLFQPTAIRKTIFQRGVTE